MAAKNTNTNKTATQNSTALSDVQANPDVIFTSKQEVADELKMSVYQFNQLLNRYPFSFSGVSGKIMGRWRVTKDDIWRWFRYVQRQEIRHPDSRRMRPEEPPELVDIHGRIED